MSLCHAPGPGVSLLENCTAFVQKLLPYLDLSLPGYFYGESLFLSSPVISIGFSHLRFVTFWTIFLTATSQLLNITRLLSALASRRVR